MNKILTLVAFFFCNLTSLNAGNIPLRLYMSCTPENPIVGEQVTWSVFSVGGIGHFQYIWNADYNDLPELYDWSDYSDVYPFFHTTSIKAIYATAGLKSVSVAVSSGSKYTQRTLSANVAEGRITLLTPVKNEIWTVGQTYLIRWKTEGCVPTIQVGLWDERYPSETGNSGEEILAQEIPNVGFFRYKVQPPRPDGISAGNLGGKNYKISVGGFGNSVGDYSDEFFTIKMLNKKG